MNNRLFSLEDIKSYDFEELNGKVLRIIVTEGNGITLIGGEDIKTGIIYLIHQY